MSRWWALLPLTAVVVGGWMASAQEPLGMKGEPGKEVPSKGSPKGDGPGAMEAAGLRLVAGQRAATAEGHRGALGYTSTPLIDVTQPRADMLLVTMTGATAAGGVPCEDSFAELVFDLSQVFTVVDDRLASRPAPRPVKLVLEAQLIGLFRANRDGAGTAAITVPAEACISAGGTPVSNVGFPGRTHSGKDALLISDRTPAVEALVLPGEFVLGQKMTIRTSHPKKCFHKNVVMAVFGEVGRHPEWLNLLDPVRDLPRGRDLGFRVTVRVEPVPPSAPVMPPPK
jgi:hypothetical protein